MIEELYEGWFIDFLGSIFMSGSYFIIYDYLKNRTNL